MRNKLKIPKGHFKVALPCIESSVSVFPSKKIFKQFVKDNKLKGYNDIDDDQGLSCFVNYNNRKFFFIAIFDHSRSLVYHEVLHVIQRILKYKGIPVNIKNTEIQAYIQGYVAESILNHKKYKRKIL